MHALRKVTPIFAHYSMVLVTLCITALPAQADSRGEILYMQRCAMCHQPDGEGILGFFPPLTGNPLVTSDDPAKIQEYLGRIIFGYHGGLIVNKQVYSGNMPPIGYHGRINDSELLDLINYQRQAWGNKAKPITAMDIARARIKGTP
jgi:mono/diheme cytochrome c family protein